MSDENVEREKAEANKSADEHYGGMLSDIQRDVYIAGYLAHARASRPREAKCPACGGVGEHVEGKRGFTRFPCPNAAPPVAPEACPRCHGGGLIILADVPGEGRICGGRCPCGARLGPATPASATAEGGGDVRLFMRACQVLGCGARGVTENAGPWYCAIHHPEHPAYATPASAAGREGAVEKVVEAAKALRKAHLRWAEHHEQHDEVCDFGCHAAKQGAEMGFDEALDALLAAEAAERGEKEA